LTVEASSLYKRDLMSLTFKRAATPSDGGGARRQRALI